MSLEIEIAKLTVAVEALTAALGKAAITATSTEKVKVDPVSEVKEAVKSIEPKAKSRAIKANEAKQELPQQTSSDELTLKDMQDLCLTITRSDDRSKVKKVKDVILKFGGEALIKDVEESKWPELKIKLEELL